MSERAFAGSDCPLTVIGLVRTARLRPEHTPVQSSLNPDEPGRIEVAPDFVDGLEGLAGFDFAWLLTWLDRGGGRMRDAPMRQTPFLLGPKGAQMGIFATRGPRRVNPIGLSLIRLRSVQDGVVHFTGVDVVDETPVIDLKPFVAQFDRPEAPIRSGWFDEAPLAPYSTPASLGSMEPREASE